MKHRYFGYQLNAIFSMAHHLFLSRKYLHRNRKNDEGVFKDPWSFS